jgi:hypothetical protein
MVNLALERAALEVNASRRNDRTAPPDEDFSETSRAHAPSPLRYVPYEGRPRVKMRSADGGAFSAGGELDVARREVGGIVQRSPYAETMCVSVQVGLANR